MTPDPTKSFLIQKLLSALSCKRSVDIRIPVTRPVLHEFICSLRFTNSSAFQRPRDVGLVIKYLETLPSDSDLSQCSYKEMCDAFSPLSFQETI